MLGTFIQYHVEIRCSVHMYMIASGIIPGVGVAAKFSFVECYV